MKQPGFFDVDARLARLSSLGNQLEAFSRTVDFEVLWSGLVWRRFWLSRMEAKRKEDGSMSPSDLAIPFFEYKSYVSIGRKFRLIRKWKTTDAAPVMVRD